MNKPYRLASEGNQNLKNIIAKDATLSGYSITNGGTEVRFVKFYDKSSAPVLAEDVPVLTVAVPPGTTVSEKFDGRNAVPFKNGISHSIVKKLADTNAEGVTAQEISLTVFYSG